MRGGKERTRTERDQMKFRYVWPSPLVENSIRESVGNSNIVHMIHSSSR